MSRKPKGYDKLPPGTLDGSLEGEPGRAKPGWLVFRNRKLPEIVVAVQPHTQRRHDLAGRMQDGEPVWEQVALPTRPVMEERGD